MTAPGAHDVPGDGPPGAAPAPVSAPVPAPGSTPASAPARASPAARRARRAFLVALGALLLAEAVLQLVRPAFLDAIRERTFHVAPDDADYITLQPLNFDARTGSPLLVYDAERFWRMAPHRRGAWFLTEDVRTNALGLRGPPLPAAREQGALRLLVLGDSVTFGFRVAEHERWGDRVAERLAAELPGRSVSPVNAAVIGYATSQGRRWLSELLEAVRPDLVLACYGINDCIGLDASDAALVAITRSATERLRGLLRGSQAWCALEGGWAWLCREANALSTGRRRAVVHWLRYPGVPVSNRKVPRTSEEEYLGHLAAMLASCREAGVPFVVLNEYVSPDVPSEWPMPADYFERVESRFDALAGWARAQGVPLADARAALRRSELTAAELLVDPFHPTPAGHDLVAEEVVRTLRDAGLVDGLRRR
jgi:lysophospholipase L1-like esterase